MNTILTILMYFAIASVILFVVGLAIQSMQSSKKPSKSEQTNLKEGQSYINQSE
ncbi:hypothetical protein [Pelagicoccus albus]|uniref:Uncharacterized protein n=1 Tax=Pelagicoccus albus TaxID=415222 RepID=A0A7X1BBU2_9BACT|nr:hypothetical protein [Pelagicoccus albus]MBC2608055.1 hypothetical protein [Pelagicoccus albus]